MGLGPGRDGTKEESTSELTDLAHGMEPVTSSHQPRQKKN